MKHVLGSAIIAAVMAAAPAFAEAVKINAVTLAPKPVYINGPFKNFIDEVNDKFAGKVEINWRGGPEVMPAFKQAEGVRNGAMDMTYTSPSYYQGLVPTSGTMNLSFKNYDEIAATDYHERMTGLHAEKDLVYLGPRFRSEVHHRQALFEMRAQARMKKGPGGENFDRRSLR